MTISLLKKLVLAAIAAGTFLNAHAALKTGDALPDLATFNLEGTLPDTKGKIVLLDFWASWCQPCQKSFPVLDELQKKYGDRLVIIGVNVDEKKSNMEEFLHKHAPTFAVVHDGAQKLVAAAEPATMPTSFIIDAAGKVRFLHNGFHGNETRDEYAKEIDSLLR